MTEITSVLNESLKQRAQPLIADPHFSTDRINEFLKDAYQINRRASELISYLRSIRQPYLSTAPPSRRKQVNRSDEPVFFNDTQRDQIDAEAKTVLRDLHAAVNSLSQAEQVRQEAELAILQKRRHRRGFGALGKWAAGGGATVKSPEEEQEDGKMDTIKLHRDGVVWFLQRRLEFCGTAQSSMMEIRIKREVEKSKSALYKTKATGPVPVWEPGQETSLSGAGLLPEELDRGTGGGSEFEDGDVQLLAQENRDMLKHFENKLDQVRKAEKSLLEISELQSTLANNLEIQSAHIDQLVQDSFFATENVGSGNKELKRASERRSTAKAVFFGTVGLCGFLVVWDLII